jgi:phenylacetate-CoA ligase
MKVYDYFPTPMRSLAASLRGLYLRYWRYGPETERLVEETLSRESLSIRQWKVWQEERLAYVLHRAATRVPYYREQWNARRRSGDRASWEYIENWPILEKETVRENPLAFLADDREPRRMFHERTSGTTGKPLNLWWSKNTVRAWYALSEARIRYWNGISRRDRWAMLGGQLVTPASQRQPPFWVWNRGLNQLYMSSYHLAPSLVEFYLDAMIRHRLTYIYGYTSSLYALAEAILGSARQDMAMAAAITTAEPVYEHQRTAIARAFNCPVRETYGMTELVAAASECSVGRLHLWPEVGSVEVVGEKAELSPGSSGNLVCTGLLNIDMPLIRYRTGDQGSLGGELDACGCGRALPILASVDGRADDLLYTSDGRRIGRLDPLFKGDLPIQEAQIVQEELNCFRVRYVPAPDFKRHHETVITQRLQERMGMVKVVMESINAIPRGPNGKFRAVICNLSREEKEFIKSAETSYKPLSLPS